MLINYNLSFIGRLERHVQMQALDQCLVAEGMFETDLDLVLGFGAGHIVEIPKLVVGVICHFLAATMFLHLFCHLVAAQ